jgi:hypothetical protein
MQITSPVKAIIVALVAAALIWLGFTFVQPVRYAILLGIGVLFLTFAYFVVIFRGRARDIALVCATLALGFGGIEMAVSRLGGFATTYKEKGSWGPRGDLGWSPMRPGVIHEKKVAANGDVIYDVTNTIDENLNRKVVSATSGPTVAFFGDSFTFGAGLNDADTLPQIFADLTGRKFRVLNLAVTAYGPQQFLRALETDAYVSLLKQDPRLFIMLTSPWHAARTSCKDRNSWYAPSYALVNGEPVYRGSCADQVSGFSGALRSLLRSTEMFQYFFDARMSAVDAADMDLYTAILVKAGKLAREKYNVPTLILYLPDDLASPRYHLDPAYSNANLMRKLQDGELTVDEINFDVAHYPANRLVIAGDGHPTGFTNRIWGQRLEEIVKKQFNANEWRKSIRFRAKRETGSRKENTTK